MSWQIIKQPSGKYCLFSSIIDNVIYYDLKEVDDIVKAFIEDYKEKTKDNVEKKVKILNEGGKPYHQFTMDFEEMLETIKEQHGKKEYKEIKKLLT